VQQTRVVRHEDRRHRRRRRLPEMSLIVGVDIGKSRHAAWMIDPGLRPIARAKIAATPKESTLCWSAPSAPLKRDADPYIIGRERVYERGDLFRRERLGHQRFPARDRPDAGLLASRVRRHRQSYGKNILPMTLPADSVKADDIVWEIPTTARPGAYRVNMHVLGSDGQALSTNSTDITVL
jgi:hypothetical protein